MLGRFVYSKLKSGLVQKLALAVEGDSNDSSKGSGNGRNSE
jgi:hypothetical protein